MEIKLLAIKVKKDQDGFPMEEIQEVEVFATEKSVTRTELYESMKAGMTAKAVYEIRQEDWNEAKEISDDKCVRRVKDEDSTEHDIIRTYKVGKATIELVCG